ncbi:TetR/AcrR family transcriptional regulator [Devosia nitrariae]|uniref:TetR family transcriptional regulator n=1 Tax=Devosia nitrariae TaxID=2071872 RepID=A0ABQ5W1C2_9HYPH|nr:TetR/AcrR family transcriptional regulator [Devosia nitrariae]GLQ53715.1 TetR family transcriptional regulator [Devosia nitrariae]
MGRKRVVDQESILDAAELVVAQDGAANLTLERVAMQAGVSKATVLYDYKSKQAVLEAVVERAFARDHALHARVEEGLEPADSPAMRSRIVAAAAPPPEAFRNAALNLSAALVLDEELRRNMQANQSAVLARIGETAVSPRGAQLAYLALEGLKLLEYLDFHHFDKTERARILREINWLVAVKPGQEPLPSGQ